jgi:hypothetical protein
MSTQQNQFPKLHNAMWPGLVGKGSPGAEPCIDLDTMLDLTANASVDGVKFDGVDIFLFDPHVSIDISDDGLKQLADKIRAKGFVVGSVVAPIWPPTGGGSATASATYVRADATTQGTWNGSYGRDGFSLAGGTVNAVGNRQIFYDCGICNGAMRFVNAGTLNVGGGLYTATLEIRGPYTQTATGALNFQLGGTNQGEYNVLIVRDNPAALNGTLALDPDSVARVHARFAGEVVEVGADAGLVE